MTLERLKALLRYSPKTGLFTRLTTRGGELAGSIAGWCSGRYVVIGIDGIDYYAHRLAWFYMTGRWPKQQIDHKNRRHIDNRWRNLREATSGQNHRNTNRASSNTSGVKGVGWHKARRRWRARIRVDGVIYSLGYHRSLRAAKAARRAGERKHHGEFASRVMNTRGARRK